MRHMHPFTGGSCPRRARGRQCFTASGPIQPRQTQHITAAPHLLVPQAAVACCAAFQPQSPASSLPRERRRRSAPPRPLEPPGAVAAAGGGGGRSAHHTPVHLPSLHCQRQLGQRRVARFHRSARLLCHQLCHSRHSAEALLRSLPVPLPFGVSARPTPPPSSAPVATAGV